MRFKVGGSRFRIQCEDRVLDGPASGGKGSKGMNLLDGIRGRRRKDPHQIQDGTRTKAPTAVTNAARYIRNALRRG